MKKLAIPCLFFIYFFLQSTFILAQKQGQALIDSLLTILPKAKEDTSKVNLLNLISYNYSGVHNKKIMVYATQALQLATKLKWNKGIAEALVNTAPYYLTTYEYDTALTNLSKALLIAAKENYPFITGQSKLYVGYIWKNRQKFKINGSFPGCSKYWHQVK
jgi:hypothetical protein